MLSPTSHLPSLLFFCFVCSTRLRSPLRLGPENTLSALEGSSFSANLSRVYHECPYLHVWVLCSTCWLIICTRCSFQDARGGFAAHTGSCPSPKTTQRQKNANGENGETATVTLEQQRCKIFPFPARDLPCIQYLDSWTSSTPCTPYAG